MSLWDQPTILDEAHLLVLEHMKGGPKHWKEIVTGTKNLSQSKAIEVLAFLVRKQLATKSVKQDGQRRKLYGITEKGATLLAQYRAGCKVGF